MCMYTYKSCDDISKDLVTLRKYMLLFGYLNICNLQQLNAWLRYIQNEYKQRGITFTEKDFPAEVSDYVDLVLIGKSDVEIECFFRSRYEDKNDKRKLIASVGKTIQIVVKTIRDKNIKSEIGNKERIWFISKYGVEANPESIFKQLKAQFEIQMQHKNYSYDKLIAQIVKPLGGTEFFEKNPNVLNQVCGVVIGFYYFYNLTDENNESFYERYRRNYRRIKTSREKNEKKCNLLDSIKGKNIQIKRWRERIEKLSRQRGLMSSLVEPLQDRFRKKIGSLEQERDEMLTTYFSNLHLIAFGDDRVANYEGSTKLFNVFDIECLPPKIGNINNWRIFSENGIVIPDYGTIELGQLYNYAIKYMESVVSERKRKR